MSECATRPGGRTSAGVNPVWGPGSCRDRVARGAGTARKAAESRQRAGWRRTVPGGWRRRVPPPVGRCGALQGGSGRQGGRSSRGTGQRRSLHHGVSRAPWRRRRVLPRRGKCRARVPQPRSSPGERAPGTRGRRRCERILDPDAPRSRPVPAVQTRPQSILQPSVFLGTLLGQRVCELRLRKPTR